MAHAERESVRGKTVLLIVSGGIAAYKTPELVRRGRERGYEFRCVVTKAAAEFVSPLTLASVSNDKVFQDLFSLTDEAEMGHIRLSREADLIVVAPATADIMAKMASGLADDLASTILLARDKPVLVAPAMNPMMWQHPATKRNLRTLLDDGIVTVGPGAGDMACGEIGDGRMAEPFQILEAMDRCLSNSDRPLEGLRALVTSGPTHEAIDPVRFIANASSGKQGHAIAAELAEAGANVTLVSGPTALADPKGIETIHVTSAQDMYQASANALPVDIAVFAAAVADWRPRQTAQQKLKKGLEERMTLEFVRNPDILAEISTLDELRPKLVIGFAAETENLVDNARAKLAIKRCDWIIANDVNPKTGVFGGNKNSVAIVEQDRVDPWPELTKAEVARRLVDRIAAHFGRE